MNERRRPYRRGRGPRPSGQQSPEPYGDADPYLEPMDSTTPPPDAGELPDARDETSSPAIPSPSSNPAPAAPPPMSNSSEGNGDQQSQQQQNYSNNDNSGPQYGGGGPVAPMHDRQQYNDQTNDRGNYNRNQQGGRQGGQGGNRNNGRRGRHNQRGRGRPPASSKIRIREAATINVASRRRASRSRRSSPMENR